MYMSDEEILAKLLSYQPNLSKDRGFEFVWVVKKMMNKEGVALDIGCNGSILDKFVNENLNYIMSTTDIDPAAATYYDRTPRTNFFLHDSLEPLPDKWKDLFDFITIVSTLEHMSPEDAGLILKNAADCLKDGGRILVTLPYGDGYEMLGRWQVRCYDEKNINEITSPAGLEVVSWGTSGWKFFGIQIIGVELRIARK